MILIRSTHSTNTQSVCLERNGIKILVLMFDFYYGHFAGTRCKRALADLYVYLLFGFRRIKILNV